MYKKDVAVAAAKLMHQNYSCLPYIYGDYEICHIKNGDFPEKDD